MIELRKHEAERIMPDPVSHEVVAELRNELVALTSPVDLTCWDDIAEEVMKLLKLSYGPKVLLLTKRRVLLEVKSSEVRDLILSLKELQFADRTVSQSRWTPGCDTINSAWFIPKTRWVTFLDIPYHLQTYEVVESICKRFDLVKEFATMAHPLVVCLVYE